MEMITPLPRSLAWPRCGGFTQCKADLFSRDSSQRFQSREWPQFFRLLGRWRTPQALVLGCQEVKQGFLISCQHGRDAPLRASAAMLSAIDYPSRQAAECLGSIA